MIPPGVAMHGDVRVGVDVSVCEPAELNATGSYIEIGDGCDIAAYTVLNVADSSDKCLGRAQEIRRSPILLGRKVFIGSHCFIGGGVTIGNRVKIAAGTIIRNPIDIPDDSLVYMGVRMVIGAKGVRINEVAPVVVPGIYARDTAQP